MDPIKGLHPTNVELKTLFEAQQNKRGTHDRRWEDYAGWTLPYLYPQDDVINDSEMQLDYQALGARAVNHLANKIAMTLFAPSRPFFKLELTSEQMAEMESKGLTRAQIEVMTGKVEQDATRNMERVHMRTAMISALKRLIVLGNALVYRPSNTAKTQVFNMRDYTVVRDMSGTCTQIITRDRRICSTLPADVRDMCKTQGHKPEDEVDLYTGITLNADGKYYVKQEVEEVMVTTPEMGVYPAADLPWIPLTWELTRGQDYGVGLVEQYSGDFSVYSQLSESNLNLASIAADIKGLVNPMGQTDIDALNSSEPGTYVHGMPDDIAWLQLEKIADFKFVTEIMQTYERRIGAAFLLNSAVTRDAERVTAEEIRLQANELEGSLGGVYSRLAEELQQPLARMLIASVDSALVALEPVILTGVESLSRNSEHEQMMLFVNDLTVLNSVPEGMLAELKLRDLAKILATNRGLEAEKIMKTDEEKEAERKQAEENAARAEAKMAAAQAAGEQAGAGPQPLA